jgi:predicted ATPase/class 3 adenylate cyclase
MMVRLSCDPMTRRDFPTGTVTFLFSDIEGSTRLVQDVGPATFTLILERHNAIMRAAISQHRGIDRGTQGDSFMAVFTEAPAAVAAAVASQLELAGVVWPHQPGAAVRVRMGIHTGLGRLGGDDYVGIDIHRAARIAAAAHGGQVLISDATRALVEGDLPDGVRLKTLGSYRLKDLPAPERLHQLEIAGSPSAFPPVRALDVRRARLPPEPTTFIGRRAELATLAGLLADRRLITLTGPGGTGKTRLAIQVAALLAERFADGAVFVGLAAIRDAALIASEAASALEIREDRDRPIDEVLIDWLRDRELLLILDNLEQIEGAAPVVDRLLAAAPGVRVVATSRSPLRVSGEQEFPVPVFPVPRGDTGTEELEASESVQLFLDRARLVRPGFSAAPEHLATIADICAQVDGLPLAIELAAARVRLLSLAAIRDRLGRRMETLVGGPATVPRRQQSMRDAIAWSHDLLDEPAKALLRRSATFVGSWSLEAAEDVAGQPPVDDVAATLEHLVAQSLVQPVGAGDEPRFTMLATIQEFAAEQLEASGEALDLRARHGRWFRRLAERAEAASQGPDAEPWFDRLEMDVDNLRAAIERAAGDGDLRTALAITAALERFWLQRNHSAEGRQLLAGLIDRPDAPPGPEFARAARAAVGIETWLGDYAAGRRFGALSVAAFRELGDRAGLVDPLTSLGFATIEVDPEAALALIDESLELARAVGNVRAQATIPLARAIALFRLGRLADARASLELAVASTRETGDRYFEVMSRVALARAELLLGDFPAAAADYEQALLDSRAVDLRIGVAVSLDNYAELAIRSGDVPRAVRLASAAARMKEELGGGPPSGMIGEVDPLAVGGAELGPEEFEREFAAGRAMDMDSAIAEARATAMPTSLDRQ